MDEREKLYELSFQLIIHGGDARIAANSAVEAASEYRFEDAQSLLEKAKKELSQAHAIQTEMIQQEAAGERRELNIILVHAQDHLCMGMTAIDNAKQMIALNKRIQALEKIIKERREQI